MNKGCPTSGHFCQKWGFHSLMLVLMLLVLLVPVLSVPPSPVIFLIPLIHLIVWHVVAMPIRHPSPIVFIFLPIPVVIVPVIGIVNPALAFFLLVPLVIVLRGGKGKGPDRRH